MNILKSNKLNTTQISDIKHLSSLCGNYEPYYEEFSANLETCFFLYYDHNQLISFLSFLAIETSSLQVNDDPRSNTTQTAMEAEITAMTHPDYRLRGLFTKLFASALVQLKILGISDIYCAVPPECQVASICKGLSHIEYLQKLDFETAKSLMHENTQSSASILTDTHKPKHLHFTYTPAEDSEIPTTYELYEKKFLMRSKRIGICHLTEASDFTNIWGVEIKRPYRNQGYGLKLMKFVIHDYFKCSSKPLILNVTSSNTHACRLYKRCGFKAIEKIEYYHLAAYD